MREDRRWKYFECKRCGCCCTGIDLPYDPKSRFEIADYLGLTLKETIEKYYGRITKDGKYIEFQSHKRNPCPFLSSDSQKQKSCKIYPVRPYGCRGFPFDTPGTLVCPEARKVIDKIRKEDA